MEMKGDRRYVLCYPSRKRWWWRNLGPWFRAGNGLVIYWRDNAYARKFAMGAGMGILVELQERVKIPALLTNLLHPRHKVGSWEDTES